MKKVYLVQKFEFYNEKGIDYQMANCGELPRIFSSKKAAEKWFDYERKTWKVDIKDIQLFPYEHFTVQLNTIRLVITLQEAEVISYNEI